MVGVEAAGEGVDTDKHAATLTRGSPGVLHGSFSYLLQDSEGQIIDPHSISAGCAVVLDIVHCTLHNDAVQMVFKSAILWCCCCDVRVVLSQPSRAQLPVFRPAHQTVCRFTVVGRLLG